MASEGVKLPENADSDTYLTVFVEVDVAMSCGQEKTQKYWDHFHGIYQAKLEPMLQQVAPAFKLKGTASDHGLKI